MLKSIELPLLVTTEESSTMDNLGLSSSNDFCETVMGTFYSVDNIYPYTDDEGLPIEGECTLYSGGTSFLIKLSYEEVKRRISDAF